MHMQLRLLLLLLLLSAQVSAIFGSSLEVMISVFGETPADGHVFHCAVRHLETCTGLLCIASTPLHLSIMSMGKISV
jgi:hypothetical protein